MNIARAIAQKSKDPNTQVGALLLDPEGGFGPGGYNGLPRKVPEYPARWERPEKYRRVVHAEANALLAAARTGWATAGSTLVVTLFPCHVCAKLIIQAGVRRVITTPALNPAWSESFELSDEMLTEAGVEIVLLTET